MKRKSKLMTLLTKLKQKMSNNDPFVDKFDKPYFELDEDNQCEYSTSEDIEHALVDLSETDINKPLFHVKHSRQTLYEENKYKGETLDIERIRSNQKVKEELYEHI